MSRWCRPQEAQVLLERTIRTFMRDSFRRVRCRAAAVKNAVAASWSGEGPVAASIVVIDGLGDPERLSQLDLAVLDDQSP